MGCKKKTTYNGKFARLSLGTFDEVMGLKEQLNYDSADAVISDALTALKTKKKNKGKVVNSSQILDSLGI